MSKLEIKFSSYHGGYYIDSNVEPLRYMHTDGQMRKSLCNDEGAFIGLYKDTQSAEATIKKYGPKVTVKDLKPGDRFKCAGFDEGNEVMRVMDFSYVNPVKAEAQLMYIVEKYPTVLKWVNKASVVVNYEAELV